MGCNVSPYRGGVLKYKETVTATVDSISVGEEKTFFTASKNCIVKVRPYTSTNNCYFDINSMTAAAISKLRFYNLADRAELLCPEITQPNESKCYCDSLLLLLKPDDELQLKCTDGTLTNVQYKIYVYEWE